MFLSDGCVAAASINGVGTWHDCRVEVLLNIDHLLEHLPPKFLVAVDTGLPASARKIRGLSETELGTLTGDTRQKALTAHTLIAQLCVAAEWGVGGTCTARIISSNCA